jgi:hypothetical protein
MSDLYGDRAIQEAIEQLAEAVVRQEPSLDWREVQQALRATVEELMSESQIEDEPPKTVAPTVGPSPEARRESPPPGPPPDANPPA